MKRELKQLKYNFKKCQNCAFIKIQKGNCGFACARNLKPYACNHFFHRNKNKYDWSTEELIIIQDIENKAKRHNKFLPIYNAVISTLNVLLAYIIRGF